MMKKLALICCLVLLCACARQPSETADTPGAPSATVLSARWQKFTALSDASKLAPYRVQLSLRFGEKGDTRRVTALLWGNSHEQLRLDVMAGVGATVAKILENGEHFLVYSPTEEKAFFYQGASRPLLKVGVPVPFDLGHLADLLNGHYARVFGTEYIRWAESPRNTADRMAFYLGSKEDGNTQGLGGLLTLDAKGLPVHWREAENSSKGWQMELDFDESTPPLPSRIKLRHDKGQQAIVLVKERAAALPAFSEAQLSLPLPRHVPLLPLSQYKGQ